MVSVIRLTVAANEVHVALSYALVLNVQAEFILRMFGSPKVKASFTQESISIHFH